MALSVDPNNVDALISLGDLYKLEGMISRAQACYEDAVIEATRALTSQPATWPEDEPSQDQVRAWIDDATSRWRGEAARVGERAGATMHAVLRELGLVTRADWDDLELRVAQLEHRLRLVENEPGTAETRRT